MGIASYIKTIGRGKDGARPLTEEQAYDLFCQVLDGRVTDLEIGAFVLAMRIKGESDAELAGFLRASHERSLCLRLPAPAVLLPSYNGARKLPNLTALMALLLAREGVPVLVHGPLKDPTRVTTAEIFQTLGLPLARDAAEVQQAWSRREPAFLPLEVLSPPLARLLEVRWTIGLRGPGHTVVKLLNPTSGHPALRVVSYTHPEYGKGHHSFLQVSQADALLLRGTEGEPVADPRRQPRMEAYVGGTPRPDLSQVAQDGVLTELPPLPQDFDASTTASYIQAVLGGQMPPPAPLLAQLACVVRTLREMAPATQDASTC